MLHGASGVEQFDVHLAARRPRRSITRARAERFNTGYKAPAPRRWPGRTACFLGRRCSRCVGSRRKKAARGGHHHRDRLVRPRGGQARSAAPPSSATCWSSPPSRRRCARRQRRSARRAGETEKRRAGVRGVSGAPVGDDAAMDAERRPPLRRTFWRSASTPSGRGVAQRRCALVRRGPHDHRGLHGVLRSDRTAFCGVDRDSSCNVVFADELPPERPIRMKGPDHGRVRQPRRQSRAASRGPPEAEMLWHSGPDFTPRARRCGSPSGSPPRTTPATSFREDQEPHLWLGPG